MRRSQPHIESALLPLRYRRREWVVCAVLSALLGSAACSSGSRGDAANTARRDPVPVIAGTVTQKDLPVQVRAIGNVEAYSMVAVKSQVEGELAEVHFHEGDQVGKGDLLFTIDPRPFEAAQRQAEGNRARDRAEADNADAEAARQTRLLDQKLVSAAEHDAAQAKAASLRAAVASDEAAVENAKLALQYCYIRSPLSGRIGRILVHEGNVVKARDATLATINQIRPIYVTFAVPERELPSIRRRAAADKLEVLAAIADHSVAPIAGTLSFIDNAVDTTTGTVLLKALYANDDEALWPGQFVDVTLTLSVSRDALVVPSEAIQIGQQGQYVFVIGEDQTVEMRPVTLGMAVAGETVIESGLTPGERIVTDGQLRLAPGALVAVRGAAGADAGATPGGT